MSTSTLSTYHPPTTAPISLRDAVDERELERRLRRALTRLRATRDARRERLRAQALHEHELLTAHALLASGLHHRR